MLSITLKQLEIFTTVVETSSFRKAGDQLAFAQSTISENIADLEEAVGFELFDRSNKKNVILTDAGRAFYTHAKGILSSCYSLQNKNHGNKNPNSISIGAHYIPARYILPDVMAAYHHDHDSARFLLREGEYDELLNLLGLRKIDLCFTLKKTQTDQFRSQLIYQDPVVLALPYTKRHQELLEKGFPIRDILLSEPFVWNPSVGPEVSQYLSNLGLTPGHLNIIAEMSSEQLAKNATIEGLGLSFLSHISLKCAVKSHEILQRKLDDESVFRCVYMVSRKNSPLNEMGKDFVHFLIQQNEYYEQCNH